MTNEQIIDVVSAAEAGMRVEWLHGSQWLGVKPRWNFRDETYRVNPDDAEEWERIKAQRTNLHCKVEHPQVMPSPDHDLPPLPEDAVLLPVGFKKPEGMDTFRGWACNMEEPQKLWSYGRAWCGLGSPRIQRYAVRSDTEIARLNGVGFGPCPSPHGWHNPNNLTPEQVGVPEFRLLCRDEIGERKTDCTYIECLHSSPSKWDWNYAGSLLDATYRTRLPYGELPPVTEYTFPECAPKVEYNPDVAIEACRILEEALNDGDTVRALSPGSARIGRDKHPFEGLHIQGPKPVGHVYVDHCDFSDEKPQDPGYGYALDGKKIEPPDDRHEIIPEGTRVSEGEVTHSYLLPHGWVQWGKQYTPLAIRESGHVIPHSCEYCRAYARLKYEVLHRESGIKVGDTVRVVRKAESRERGWGNSWVSYMDRSVGISYKVIDDDDVSGFQLDDADFYFPAFVLEKVTPKMVPLEGNDWAGGPWCIRPVGGGINALVTAVSHNSGSIHTKTFGAIDPTHLMENYERALGWPGDPDLEWVRCEKPGKGVRNE